MPVELEEKIIEITHSGVFGIKFFKEKSSIFCNKIVQKLKVITLVQN